MSKFLSLFLVLACCSFSWAFNLKKDFKGFVKIDGKELYVVYAAPKDGQPTVVLLNGLTYSTRQWNAMTEYLQSYGLGVLRYDMDGMGETLLKYGVRMEPYAYTNQVGDLDLLLKELSLPKPYHIAGLSYGGGIAAAYSYRFPEKVKNVILMAPYTEPLEGQDLWIRSLISTTRKMYPYNPYSDDELYDYFLKQICYSTYPTVEPVVLENPFKLEATFRMTQGIRKFKSIEQTKFFPKNSVHMMIARKDQYIPQIVLDKFWEAVPVSARASRIYIQDSEHKIPESVPEFAAGWIYQLIRDNRNITRNHDFEGHPGDGVAISDTKTIQVLKK